MFLKDEEELKVGQVIVATNGSEALILAVSDTHVLKSAWNEFHKIGKGITRKEIKENDWDIKDQEEVKGGVDTQREPKPKVLETASYPV